MKHVLSFLLMFLLAAHARTQPTSLEAFIDDYAKTHEFNGTVLVGQKGTKLVQESFGLANFQFAIANTNTTKFKIASVTKLFTTVLIMQLYDEQKLTLEARISAYLPGYAGEGANKVSVFDLLTATSGLDPFEKNGDEVYETRLTSDEILARYCSGALVSTPGERFNYNNADYVILGKIVEKLRGKPYDRVLEERILHPLGMKSSGMVRVADVVDGLAYAYDRNEDTHAITNEPFYYVENYGASGGMYATADDLLRFATALYGGTLVSKRALELMLQPHLGSYAFGLWVYEGEVAGVHVKVAERQGSIEGSNARLLHLMNLDANIILLSNMWTASLDEFQRAIIRKLAEQSVAASP